MQFNRIDLGIGFKNKFGERSAVFIDDLTVILYRNGVIILRRFSTSSVAAVSDNIFSLYGNSQIVASADDYDIIIPATGRFDAFYLIIVSDRSVCVFISASCASEITRMFVKTTLSAIVNDSSFFRFVISSYFNLNVLSARIAFKRSVVAFFFAGYGSVAKNRDVSLARRYFVFYIRMNRQI